MDFGLIVADPPWAFGDRLKKMKSKTKRSAESQYKTMLTLEIAELDVKSIADPSGCVLALWVPGTMLVDGLTVMSYWGFQFKQIFVWVKTKKNVTKHIKKSLQTSDNVDLNELTAFGMGRLFRQTHEIALIGTMGKVYSNLKNKSQRSVMFDMNMGHSCKPDLLQDRLELMFPESNKLEMFSRRIRPDWTCIGDGIIDQEDIVVSIENLKFKKENKNEVI